MLLGRLCLSFIFILSLIDKIFNWSKNFLSLKKEMGVWVQYFLTHFEGVKLSFYAQYLEDLTPFLMLIGMIFQGLGSALLVLGVKVRAGCFLLIVFLLGSTLTGHPFWLASKSEKSLQTILFFNNVGILGGLLVLFSVRKRQKSIKEVGE